MTSPVEHSTRQEKTPLKQRSSDTQEGTSSQGTEGTTKTQGSLKRSCSHEQTAWTLTCLKEDQGITTDSLYCTHLRG